MTLRADFRVFENTAANGLFLALIFAAIRFQGRLVHFAENELADTAAGL